MLGACETSTLFTVSSTADKGSGALRAAIASANSTLGATAIRIELPASAYTLARCGADHSNQAADLDVHARAPVTLASVGGTAVNQQTPAA